MKTNILILVNQEENGYFPTNISYCDVVPLYSNNKFLNRVLRKIVLKYQLWQLEKIVFHSWISIVIKVDIVVIFDTGNASYIAQMLKKHYPSKRIIIWYWNSVDGSIPFESFKTVKGLEFWSFDPADCHKYGFKYNTQFFIKENLENVKTTPSYGNYDVFYVGADKNRSKILAELKEQFERYNIRYLFNLVRFHNSKNDFKLEYCDALTYSEVLSYVCTSKVVIDLVAEWQTGLTLRPLEALFCKKKLITNMKRIIDYDIYNPQNIFIIGIDDFDKLKEFVDSKFDEDYYEEFTRKYEFASWISRFE